MNVIMITPNPNSKKNYYQIHKDLIKDEKLFLQKQTRARLPWYYMNSKKKAIKTIGISVNTDFKMVFD